MLHGVMVLPRRAMHYVAKVPVPGIGNLCLSVSWGKYKKFPNIAWAVGIAVGGFQELGPYC